jgi:hypothetical protein
LPFEIFYGLVVEAGKCLEDFGPAIPHEQEADVDVEELIHAVTCATPSRSNTSWASR